jgi:hypothetical protein
MIGSISFSKASDHFVDANNMIKIGSNYGEFATFKTTATPQLEP